MKTITAVLTLSLAITGCATRPAKIGVGEVDLHQYSNYTCEALYVERGNRQADCDKYVSKQKNMHITDLATFWGSAVVLWPMIFVPLATPDYEDEILACRGQLQAIDTQLVMKECQ